MRSVPRDSGPYPFPHRAFPFSIFRESPGGHLCTGPSGMRCSWRTTWPPWFCVPVAHSPALLSGVASASAVGPFHAEQQPSHLPWGPPTPDRNRWTPKALAAPGAGGLFPLTLASWAAPTSLLPLFLFQMKTHVPSSKAEAQGVPGFSQQHWSRGCREGVARLPDRMAV